MSTATFLSENVNENNDPRDQLMINHHIIHITYIYIYLHTSRTQLLVHVHAMRRWGPLSAGSGFLHSQTLGRFMQNIGRPLSVMKVLHTPQQA